jgi:hypothetical protein
MMELVKIQPNFDYLNIKDEALHLPIEHLLLLVELRQLQHHD